MHAFPIRRHGRRMKLANKLARTHCMFALQARQIDMNLLGQCTTQNLFDTLSHLTHQRSVKHVDLANELFTR